MSNKIQPIQLLEQAINQANEFSQNSANETAQVLEGLMTLTTQLNERNNQQAQLVLSLQNRIQELEKQVEQEKDARVNAEKQVSTLNERIVQLTKTIAQASETFQNGARSAAESARKFLASFKEEKKESK